MNSLVIAVLVSFHDRLFEVFELAADLQAVKGERQHGLPSDPNATVNGSVYTIAHPSHTDFQVVESSRGLMRW